MFSFYSKNTIITLCLYKLGKIIVDILTVCYVSDTILSSSLANPKANTYSLSITLFFYANKTLLLF